MPNRIDLRRQQGRITIPLAVRLFLGMALLIALAIGAAVLVAWLQGRNKSASTSCSWRCA